MSQHIAEAANDIWTPILFLILLGGLYFLFYSRFIHYRYLFHSFDILRGKFHDRHAPGQISPYEALSTALAATVGMGNIAGVAASISIGGPGAMFWMWVTAFIGMSTNFFTTTLSIMYRGKDSAGAVQGGPMYAIREKLGKRYSPLAILFCVSALIGCFPVFQANQLTQVIADVGFRDAEELKSKTILILGMEINLLKLIIGCALMIMSGLVIVGGITRIGKFSGKMVPSMIVVYFLSVVAILLINIENIPKSFMLIITDAFDANNYHGSPLLGGMTGGLIMAGVRRATFSNEAGLGTSAMAMGASKTTEPVREGLVSMLSPAIDTLLVCTLTALAIIVTDAWRMPEAGGVTITVAAFENSIPFFGRYLLLLSAFTFSIATMFSYSYYGNKALSFLLGVKAGKYYDYFYLLAIVAGAVASMNDVINVIDIAYALMAVPTMISGFILAPQVMRESKSYFERMKKEGRL